MKNRRTVRLAPSALVAVTVSLSTVGLAPISSAAEPVASPSDPTAISVDDRYVLALHYVHPAEGTRVTKEAALLGAVDGMLAKHTNLRAKRIDASTVKTCQGSLACLAVSHRRELKDIRSQDGKLLTWEEYRDPKVRASTWMFVLSNVPQANTDRLFAILVDTDKLMQIFLEPDYQKSHAVSTDWTDLDAQLDEQAVVVRSNREVNSDEQAAEYLTSLFRNEMRTALDSTENWQPYGEVEITGPAGLFIELDGSTIPETTRSPVTRLVNVSPGRRTITLKNPSYEPFVAEVDVRKGERATVKAELTTVSNIASTVRDLVVWGGVAVAAVGVGVTTYALVAPQDRAVGCIVLAPGGGDTGCGESSEFLAFGFGGDPSTNPFTDDPNPGSVLIAPLGYSLVGMGAAWSLGSMYMTDDGEIPIIPLVAGLVIGAASYGVSAALNGKNAIKVRNGG